MNFIFFINNRKDYSKNIVQSSFHNELSIGNSVSENRSRSKCLFEKVESIMTEEVKLLENILLDKVC